jgi:ribosome-binding protein aMBF1 (putative translation factor)
MSNLEFAKTAIRISNSKTVNQTAQQVGQNIAQAVNNAYAAMTPPTVSVSPSRTAMQNIQAAIKAERKAQQLTQRQLASKAGMSQASITRLERHGWVSIYTMIRVIDALGKQLTIA